MAVCVVHGRNVLCAGMIGRAHMGQEVGRACCVRGQSSWAANKAPLTLLYIKGYEITSA